MVAMRDFIASLGDAHLKSGPNGGMTLLNLLLSSMYSRNTRGTVDSPHSAVVVPRRRLADFKAVTRTCDGLRPLSTLYYDSSYLGCRQCELSLSAVDDPLEMCKLTTPANAECYGNKIPDLNSIGATGYPQTCTCGSGYIKQAIQCDADTSGDTCLDGFHCRRCTQAKPSSSLDRSKCMQCFDGGFDEVTRECLCPEGAPGTSNFALVEKNVAGVYFTAGKRCIQCPDKTLVFLEDVGTRKADPYTCQACPDPNQVMRTTGVCECEDGYREAGVKEVGDTFCLENDQASEVQSQGGSFAVASRIEFNALRSSPNGRASDSIVVDSVYLLHYYGWAATNCWYYNEAVQRGEGEAARACQTLANLCVLQNYDRSSSACKLYLELMSTRGSDVHNLDQWQVTLPWLYYDDSQASDTLEYSGIKMKLAFESSVPMPDEDGGAGTANAGTTGLSGSSGLVSRSSRVTERLRFFLASYAMNGTFLGWQGARDQFYYCHAEHGDLDGPSFFDHWLFVGVSHYESYSCNLSTLIFPEAGASIVEEPVMHELWLLDQAGASSVTGYGAAGGGSLYPCPVRNLDYRSNDRTVNRNSDGTRDEIGDDQLTRRFFLYDTASGASKTATSTRSNSGGGSGRSSSGSAPNSREFPLPDVVRYASKITLRVQKQHDEARLLPPLLDIQYDEVQTAELLQGGGGHARLEFNVEYSMDTVEFWKVAEAFFILFSVAMGLFVVLRHTNWTARNARTEFEQSEYNTWWLVSHACMLMNTAAVVYTALVWFIAVYFFIIFKLQNPVHLLLPPSFPEYGRDDDYYSFEVLVILTFFFQLSWVMLQVYKQCNLDIFLVDWEKPRAKVMDEEQADSSVDAPISVWRTILCANELNQLQVLREELTLLLLAFVLRGCRLEYLATPQPDVSDLTAGPVNMLLRFANTTFWWLLFSYGQIALNRLVLRMHILENKPRRFIDLCTMAKVSCVLLDERYHGYYLHCNSKHPYADMNMVELTKQLESESAGLLPHRGLSDRTQAPEGVQTFEIFLTQGWRKRYDEIYDTQLKNNIRKMREQGRAQPQGGFAGECLGCLGFTRTRAPSEKQLHKASRNLARFLRAFADQVDPAYHLKVEEPTYMNRVMRVPPQMMNAESSKFHPINERAWTAVMLYGLEHDLLLLNILTYSVFDLWLNDTLASVLLTYVLDVAIKIVRGVYGHTNLAAKTMLDDRFLTGI